MLKIQPKTLFVGKNVIYLPTCHSTNDIASQMLQKEGIIEGTMVLTSDQTAGRGQRGNVWQSEPNQNITLSLILKPTFLKPSEQFDLNRAISLAIFSCLDTFSLPKLKIKWPNDIYVGEQKMGGILIENTLNSSQILYSIIGIGLNINQVYFSHPKATSLKNQTHQEYELSSLIEELCQHIEGYYLKLKNGTIESLRNDYIERLFRFQTESLYRHREEVFWAKITGVSPQGRLQMEHQGKVLEFDFKQVEFI